jgi:hypothetical protein
MEKVNAHDAVNRRHLLGFRRIQREIMRATKAGVAAKDYKAIAGAYKEAVFGERAVLGIGVTGGESWPDGIIIRWVDDDEQTEGEP